MADVSFEVELGDERGEITTMTLFAADDFQRLKDANERGTLKVRTFIAETTRREV